MAERLAVVLNVFAEAFFGISVDTLRMSDTNYLFYFWQIERKTGALLDQSSLSLSSRFHTQ